MFDGRGSEARVDNSSDPFAPIMTPLMMVKRAALGSSSARGTRVWSMARQLSQQAGAGGKG